MLSASVEDVPLHGELGGDPESAQDLIVTPAKDRNANLN